jgi:hypothetical protein
MRYAGTELTKRWWCQIWIPYLSKRWVHPSISCPTLYPLFGTLRPAPIVVWIAQCAHIHSPALIGASPPKKRPMHACRLFRPKPTKQRASPGQPGQGQGSSQSWPNAAGLEVEDIISFPRWRRRGLAQALTTAEGLTFPKQLPGSFRRYHPGVDAKPEAQPTASPRG